MEKHFAALNLSDDDSEHTLTRAVSLSHLANSRKILIEERYQSDKLPALERQFSCEQVYDKYSNTSQVQISHMVRSGASKHQKTWKTVVPHNNVHKRTRSEDKVEYMDVDYDQNTTSRRGNNVSPNSQTSAKTKSEQVTSSAKKVETSCPSQKSTYQEAKQNLRPLIQKPIVKQKRRMSSCCFWLLSIVIPGFLLLLSIVMDKSYFEMLNSCKPGSYFHNASIQLRESIHGQDEAVWTLTNYLLKNTPCFKVIAIVGGTGVGKSYTAEILKKNYPIKDKILQYYPPLNYPISRNTFSYIFCNLVILENLGENDILDAVQFAKTIKETEPYCLTMLAIFNLQKVKDDLTRENDMVESVVMIKDTFYNEYIDIEVISYEPLNEEALKECILEAAVNSHLKLNDKQINYVKNILVSSNNGCKGAHSKIQLVGNADTKHS